MQSDPLVLTVKTQIDCRLWRFSNLTACIWVLDERKSMGGSIICGKGGSIYCGFSTFVDVIERNKKAMEY